MTIQIAQATRTFTFNGVSLVDPGVDFSPEEIRDLYSAQYPDIITAVIEGPAVEGATLNYKFIRNVGSKGAVCQ